MKTTVHLFIYQNYFSSVVLTNQETHKENNND